MSRGCVVKINDVTVPSGWNGNTLAGVAQLDMPWGRETIYDEVPPTELGFTVLDPTGAWATETKLIGAAIEVFVTNPNRLVFRGVINDQGITATTVINPRTEKEQTVWLVDLTAADKLAELEGAILPAPLAAATPADAELFGDRYWPALKPSLRLGSILAQGANRIVSGIDWDTTYDWGREPVQATHDYAAGESALELIRRVYTLIPLGHVNYDAQTNRITIGKTAEVSGLRLAWGQAGLVEARPIVGKAINASTVYLPGDPTVTSTVGAALDSIQISHRRIQSKEDASGFEQVDLLTEVHTSRWNAAGTGQRALKIDSDIQSNPDLVQEIGQATADLVDQLNDKFSLPPLRFDFRRYEDGTGSAELDDILLATKDFPTAIYFRGSMFGALANLGPLFQIIGGTLSWQPTAAGNTGWVSDFNVAPTTGTLTPTTWDQIAPDDVSYDDLDPLISLRDTTYIVEGVPA